jgi:rhodanese-related sulfurtransferase
MQDVQRQDVQRLIEAAAQLVEVLPRDEFQQDHLPGATNIPLREIETEAGKKLDKNRPVVVYCWDSAWDLSPRAAWRLESLGFTQVNENSDGKLHRLAAGLST